MDSVEHPLADLLGIELEDLGQDSSVFGLDVRPALLNPRFGAAVAETCQRVDYDMPRAGVPTRCASA